LRSKSGILAQPSQNAPKATTNSSLLSSSMDLGYSSSCKFGASIARREGQCRRLTTRWLSWRFFCANQARTSTMKDVAREAWRLAVEYRELGDPPDIGKKPPPVEEI
jgi:hypothetical protein